MQVIFNFILLFFVIILKLLDRCLAFLRSLQTFFIKIISFPKIIFLYFIKQRKKRTPETTHLKKKSLTKVKYFIIGSVFSFFFIFLPLAIVIFVQDLPNPHDLSLRQIPQTTRIYDRNGKILYQIYANQNRTLITLDQVPEYLQEATIAIEDKNFYIHPGFDIRAILRALWENVNGRSLQGGSTITQQLIKSSMLTPKPSIIRKMKEIILAFWSERLYSKQQILEMYFNQIPYGGTAWGIEAASEVYFDKSVGGLSLAESAFLAGITAAPTSYSPFGQSPDLWKQRQKEVLDKMVSLKYISSSQATGAEKEHLIFKPRVQEMKAPHFVEYIRSLLEEKYGIAMVERGGLNVITSLDLTLQEESQVIVKEEVEKASGLHVTNGASLVTNPQNGDVLAMVGSKDFNEETFGKYNLATSRRQPGSSIKAVTYSAALSNGFTAATILDDSPVTYFSPGSDPYTPVNYDGTYRGKVPLRFALANSLNVPAVKTLNRIGVPTMVEYAKKMGIKSWSDSSSYGLSLTLGAAEVTMLDMATVFGTLANEGDQVEINPILKISDYKGTVYEEKKTVLHTPVLSKGVSYIMSDILADSQTRSAVFGQNSILNIPNHFVSVKTGTSDSKRDNWTVGYTNDFVVTVWVGNNDNSPMSPYLASGITGAAPIWNRIMTGLVGEKHEEKYAMPDDVVTKQCLGRAEFFLKGTENSVNCTPASQPQATPTRPENRFFRFRF